MKTAVSNKYSTCTNLSGYERKHEFTQNHITTVHDVSDG